MPNTVSTQATSDLGPKLVRAEQALTAIPPGSRIYLGTGCAAPRHLLATLEAMSPGPPDLEFVSFVTTSAVRKEAGVPRTRHRHRTFFVGSDVRGLGGSGQLDYVPISLEDVPELLASGKLPIDVALRSPLPIDAASSVSACRWISRPLSCVLHAASSPRLTRRCPAPTARASSTSTGLTPS
jgi:acyl-CoA hydrolase